MAKTADQLVVEITVEVAQVQARLQALLLLLAALEGDHDPNGWGTEWPAWNLDEA